MERLKSAMSLQNTAGLHLGVVQPGRVQQRHRRSSATASMLLQAPNFAAESEAYVDSSIRPRIDLNCPGTLWVFGLGYTALGLASQLQRKGWRVCGTTRTRDKQRALSEQGVEAYIFDPDNMSLGLGKQGLDAMKAASHVLVSFSPPTPEDYCPILWMLGREFKALSENLCWIGYLSSTSVYGDHQGAWVDEECELRAVRGTGLARAASENAWLYFGDVTGLPVHVFRLAGIYGPGRNAIQAAQKGSGGRRDGKMYTSRCHVHDICQALMASMASPIHGEIYNIADDDPTNRESVIQFVQQELLEAPAAEAADSDVQPSHRQVDEKRVSNTKLKEELGVELQFPTYREGLKAIYEGNTLPFSPAKNREKRDS